MSDSRASEQRLRDLALLRRVRDRIDREYARPLDADRPAVGHAGLRVRDPAGNLIRIQELR